LESVPVRSRKKKNKLLNSIILKVPYDLGGTTVTSITRNAYINALKHHGYKPEIKTSEIDPIQQIVIPSERNLELLNVDTRRIGAKRIPDFNWEKEKYRDYIEVTDFYGCVWNYTKGHDLYFNQATFPLEKYDTLSEGISSLKKTDWKQYNKTLISTLSEQVNGTEPYCIVADRNTAGLTENSLRIRGYEKWYMDTVIEPNFVEELIERITIDKIKYWDTVIDWAIENNREKEIQVISECDDLGSQDTTIIDPTQLRTMVIPYLKKMFTHIRKRLPHVKIFMHSCGAIREVIPDLIDAGVDILNPVQFTASGMELKGLKKDFGDSLTFWGGGVDTQNTLNKGTAQEVKEEVKKILDIMAPGGGFVFAPVHNIQDDVTPENFWAMWDTLQEYGKY
jgi:uroporphyrinogen decarboxylase